jgi:RNA-directed DNA polymerase
VYDSAVRRALAVELAGVLLDGPWRLEALGERAAGALDPRPEWIEALAFGVLALGRTAPVEDLAGVIAHIEEFLRARTPPPGDPPPPQIISRLRADPDDTPPARRELDHDWPIAELASVPELARRLELSDGQLAWLADVRGLERTVDSERLRSYRYRWVPRRSGLPRLIEAPKLRLKEVQRWILRSILDAVPPHAAAHGFTRGRSVLSHASAHVGRPAVLRLDLRDFFASVSAGRVFGIFRTLGYHPAVAHVLTGLTTNTVPHVVWNTLPRPGRAELLAPRFALGRRLATPHLPQGAPSSPALANLAALGLDRRLTGLAAVHELHYSRYADDLTFSGAGLSGPRSRRISERVAEIARHEGFRLHPAKSNLRTAARRQTVTGIVVNAHPNLARADFDRLKASLHRLARDGGAAAEPEADGVELRARLNGRVAWVESLNPHRGAKLRRLFDGIDWG